MSRPVHEPAAATRVVRSGVGADLHHGAVIPPLHLSASFTFAALGEPRTHDYSRGSNPTREELAGALAALEGGRRAVITSSGMAAATLVTQLLRPGERVVVAHDCYGGTWRLLRHLADRGLCRVDFVDLTDPAATEAALQEDARLVWVETPSNPLLRITDIRGVSALAHARGALVVADNTFLSPALQRPLSLGADLVIHSTTKYLNGHSDVIGGAVVAADAALGEHLAWWANCLGICGSPFDAWLTLRGLRTLHPRIRAHQENAWALVEMLRSHPAVTAVHYPGLPGHAGHAIAVAQQDGFGAVVSLELPGGTAAVRRFLDGLRYFSLAESLGGVESLIAHPATMTHASMEPAARARAGITDGLLRLSVGIEDAGDLLGDVATALERAGARATSPSAARGASGSPVLERIPLPAVDFPADRRGH